MGHKDIQTTMKYYVVSPEEFEQEEMKRLDVIMDTYVDTSKTTVLMEPAELLEKSGEPCRIRTCDPLIKSYYKTVVTDTGKTLNIPCKPSPILALSLISSLF